MIKPIICMHFNLVIQKIEVEKTIFYKGDSFLFNMLQILINSKWKFPSNILLKSYFQLLKRENSRMEPFY